MVWYEKREWYVFSLFKMYSGMSFGQGQGRFKVGSRSRSRSGQGQRLRSGSITKSILFMVDPNLDL